MANATVSADTSEVILLVSGMAPGKAYPVRVSAVNAAGAGPAAEAALLLDPAGRPGGASGVLTHPGRRLDEGEVLGYTWVIALLGSLAFVLILISAVMIYYRYIHRRTELSVCGMCKGAPNIAPKLTTEISRK